MKRVNIVGAGLAGLSAALTLAGRGQKCNLISIQPSERAQSVLAEGGINAALDTMGERDSFLEHYEDTMRGGAYLADPNAVYGLVQNAPDLVKWLVELGVPFHMEQGRIILRNFGGQKKKRTAYAKSSTGKMIVTALVDEARKYEVAGMIDRYPHHEFVELLLKKQQTMNDETDKNRGEECVGVRIKDVYTGRIQNLEGSVILASGGLNGFFPGMTTGTTANSGDVTATVFAQGVQLSNLEMLQFHPTTIGIAGKRCLVTEAARGEGGRLFVERDRKPWYFMEEKYPRMGNLMPRDVISREIFSVIRRADCGNQVYLDLTGLDMQIWKKKLPDLREEIQHYLGLDPAREPVAVEPGIHYFMGGIDTDEHHRTNIPGLYAAGECTSQYHGANRLGGNSMLGALYGGRVSAEWAIADGASRPEGWEKGDFGQCIGSGTAEGTMPLEEPASVDFISRLSAVLLHGLGIVRNEESLKKALEHIGEDFSAQNVRERNRLILAEAMLRSALVRKESRGAHFREDYPEQSEAFRKISVAEYVGTEVLINLRDLPERRGS